MVLIVAAHGNTPLSIVRLEAPIKLITWASRILVMVALKSEIMGIWAVIMGIWEVQVSLKRCLGHTVTELGADKNAQLALRVQVPNNLYTCPKPILELLLPETQVFNYWVHGPV